MDLVKAAVEKELTIIEELYNVKILFACESGSRAWGFESSDSDYDIRYIYVRPLGQYLSTFPLEEHIDAIFHKQTLPDGAEIDLDLAGWDISKTVKLIHKVNGSICEWSKSPVLYRNRDNFQAKLAFLATFYLNPARLAHHYRAQAQSIRYRYLEHAKNVNTKKLLYAIRCILSSRYVVEQETTPPISFYELLEVSELTPSIKEELLEILSSKKEGIETNKVSISPELMSFISVQLEKLLSDCTLSGKDYKPKSLSSLNRFKNEAIIYS